MKSPVKNGARAHTQPAPLVIKNEGTLRYVYKRGIKGENKVRARPKRSGARHSHRGERDHKCAHLLPSRPFPEEGKTRHEDRLCTN